MNSGMWDWTIGRADRAADEEAQESKSLFYKQPIIKRYQKISNPLQHLRVNGWMLKHHGAVTSDLSNPYHRSWEFQTQYQTLRPYQTISDHQDRNEIETSLDSHGFGLSWQSCVENIGKRCHWRVLTCMLFMATVSRNPRHSEAPGNQRVAGVLSGLLLLSFS